MGKKDKPSESLQKLDKKLYEKELARLQVELVKLQEWIMHKKLRVVVIFEGRDAAGKGGVIERIMHRLNPRVCRVVALAAPTEREEGQWYFQRYIAQLPTAGEMVLFDRSWYTLAGVERVMEFYPKKDVKEFFRSCPEFERMLIRSGTIVIKYWFAVSSAEQERRFTSRLKDPAKRWKLSPMDMESRSRWDEYSKARDDMFKYTDIKEARWWVVEGNDKRRARLNCISHLLSMIPYKDLPPSVKELPGRKGGVSEDHPPIELARVIPRLY